MAARKGGCPAAAAAAAAAEAGPMLPAAPLGAVGTSGGGGGGWRKPVAAATVEEGPGAAETGGCRGAPGGREAAAEAVEGDVWKD